MSSSQVNYPDKISIKGKGEDFSLNLNKGPQRENITLEGFKIKLIRNGHAIQPVLKSEKDRFIHSLSLDISLIEKWSPLLKTERKEAYTSLLLKNIPLNSMMQIHQDPRNRGLVKISLSGDRKKISLKWIIDRNVLSSEELSLPAVHFVRQEKKLTPVRFGIKEGKEKSLSSGRLLSFTSVPAPQDILDDIRGLAEKKVSFDFYLLNYGTAPVWGNWKELVPGLEEKIPSLADEIRRSGAIPGIGLSPLTVEKKSAIYRNNRELLLEKGKSRHARTHGTTIKVYPLDITREKVQAHLTETLNYYVNLGFRFFHFDHLDSLLEEGQWFDPSRGPLDRLRLFTRILEGFKSRGVKFSASRIPITGGIEIFDILMPSLSPYGGTFTSEGWNEITGILEMALELKNSPPLSMGGLKLKVNKKGIRENRLHDILVHTQSLLNGPALLEDDLKDLDDSLLSTWKRETKKNDGPLLPLELSETGFLLDVLLLVNRKRRVGIFNLTKSGKVIILKEGELGDYKGLSPSQSTALKSNELVLHMKRESSHIFQV